MIIDYNISLVHTFVKIPYNSLVYYNLRAIRISKHLDVGLHSSTTALSLTPLQEKRGTVCKNSR